MTSGVLRPFFSLASKLVLIVVALYSLVHFGHTVAHTRCIGDFIAAFPGPFVARYNPELCDDVWSIYGIEIWQRVKSAPPSVGIGQNDPKRVVIRGHEYLMSKWQYGPILHFITLPLTWLPNLRLVCFGWTGANLFFLAVTAVLIYRMVAPPHPPGVFTIVYLALWGNFYPLLEVFRQGNIELFEFMLVVLACVWFKRDAIRSGFLLGMAAMTKFLPLIFLPYCAMKKSWKVLVASLVTVGIIALLTELLLGWNNSLLFKELPTAEHTGFVWGQHQTLNSLIGRWLADFPKGLLRSPSAYFNGENATLAFGVYQVGCGVSFMVALWVFLKTRATIIADFSLLVSAMIFLPPWNHPYYQVFLLLPFSFLLGRLWQAPSIPKWALLTVCYLGTVSLIVPLSVVDSFLNRLFEWPNGSFLTLLRNLSFPAWANLIVILWLIKERLRGDTPNALG